ncbi:MAG: DUF1727 domain-containing protein [Oscillospiraceae bacterium]|nr:DUF1727 domain-containing protein [Oscillospiraceae bacterium]
MKRDSFIRGMFAAYAAIVITKILGVLYSIPFYNIIGEEGGVIYSCVYNIYALFLDISTCGIPVAVSIVISEYHTRGMYRSEKRAYSAALRIVIALSVLSFAIMQIFADGLAAYILKDMTSGVSPDTIARGIRIISLCMLIVPFMSVRRGLLQGYKYVAVSSQSQVIEQLVRIIVALAGAFVAVKLMGLSVEIGVDTAFSGTVLGALAALIYISQKNRILKAEIRSYEDPENDDTPMRSIVSKLISISIPIIIVSLTVSIYSVVDMKLILVGLHRLGFADTEAQVIASVESTWAPRICMIISALPMGIVSSIAPFMAESNAGEDRRAVNDRLNQALGVLLLISVPLAAGMILFAEPLYRLFYGASEYGAGILSLLVVVNVIGGISTVMNTTMQSVGRGKAVCVCTFTGIVLNAALDLPLIYLFARLGIPAYLGAAVASIIGQAVTVAMQAVSLRRSHGCTAAPLLRNLVRIIVASVIMFAVVFALRALWPATRTRGLLLVVQLFVYAAVGIIVFGPIVYFTGTAERVFGRPALEHVLDRFHIRGIVGRIMFFPALWAGKLLLAVYMKTGRRQDDKPGMASMLLCSDFLKYAAKPGLTIVVLGTNGKTTISSMVADVLRQRGMSVSYSDWGANHHAGNARTLLESVNIFNKPTVDATVIELDEIISPINVPKLRPDYIIVSNLARDSMLRNATPEYVEGCLVRAAEESPGSVVIVNADDPLCRRIGDKNRRIYYGAADLHTHPGPNVVSDFAVCPKCSSRPEYEYRNYRHIGKFTCPGCGFATPHRDYFVSAADAQRAVMTVRTPSAEYDFPMISRSVFNVYNEAAVITLFMDMGVPAEELGECLSATVIPPSRETDSEAGGIKVFTRMAKGQNATATSSVFESISKEPGEKEIILLLDEVYDNPNKSETAAYIFDTDYEFLNNEHIKKIIVGGERYLDHRVRLLMAGVPEEKMICIRGMQETAGFADVSGIDSIYILHDVYYVSRGHAVRDAVIKRIEDAGRCSE